MHCIVNTWIISSAIHNYHPDIINESQITRFQKILRIITIIAFAVFVILSNSIG
jgi:hypothetical protein